MTLGQAAPDLGPVHGRVELLHLYPGVAADRARDEVVERGSTAEILKRPPHEGRRQVLLDLGRLGNRHDRLRQSQSPRGGSLRDAIAKRELAGSLLRLLGSHGTQPVLDREDRFGPFTTESLKIQAR
jgi:hypothetical protein